MLLYTLPRPSQDETRAQREERYFRDLARDADLKNRRAGLIQRLGKRIGL